jgi:hypothetical protein
MGGQALAHEHEHTVQYGTGLAKRCYAACDLGHPVITAPLEQRAEAV